jgi:hypothetical protein
MEALTKDTLQRFIQEYIKDFRSKASVHLDNQGRIDRSSIAELERMQLAISEHFGIEEKE